MQLLNLVAKNGHPTSICGQTMQLMHFIRSGGQHQILLTVKLLFYATNCIRVGPQLGCLNLSGCQKAALLYTCMLSRRAAAVVCRTTAASMGAFLDAFQKVADLANNSHGTYFRSLSAATVLRGCCSCYASYPVTGCSHFTAGCATSCTTGWVNYANEPSQSARSSQDAYGVIRLRHSKAAVWTVDSRRCGVIDRIFLKNSYLLFLPSIAYDSEGSITTLQNSTLFIYSLYEYSKRFIQPVVQWAAKCKQTLTVLFVCLWEDPYWALGVSLSR